VLGMETSEVNTHSQLLAELLNPKGTHGLGDVFLRLWLEQLGIEDFDSSGASCFAEYFIGPVTPTEGGRIDLLIAHKSQRIIIENKIFAGDQVNQLLRYYNFDSKAPLYYLTLFGTAPSMESTGKGQLKPDQYTCISYATDVLQWLEKCRKEAADVPVLRETITQYIALIKKLTNQHFDGKMQTQLVNTILQDPDNLTAFLELQSQGLTQAVYEKALASWEADLQKMAEPLGLKLHYYFEVNKQWKGFAFYGDPDLDALQVWINIQFDRFPNGLKVGFSYLPDASGTFIKPSFDLSPLTLRFKDVYGKNYSDWWPCYTYWDYTPEAICRDSYFSDAFVVKFVKKLPGLRVTTICEAALNKIETCGLQHSMQ